MLSIDIELSNIDFGFSYYCHYSRVNLISLDSFIGGEFELNSNWIKDGASLNVKQTLGIL